MLIYYDFLIIVLGAAFLRAVFWVKWWIYGHFINSVTLGLEQVAGPVLRQD